MSFQYRDSETGKPFIPPVWWECSWRRIACGKETCLMCGKIKKIEEQAGEELFPVPEDDPSFDFSEALHAIEEDALTHGFDLGFPDEIPSAPRPDQFQLYRRVTMLGKRLDKLGRQLADNRAIQHAESFKDLRWYGYSVRAKTYRQLCNRWYRDRGETFSDLDYHYTQYVLSEICRILDLALSNLLTKTDSHQKDILVATRHLAVLEHELLSI